MIEVTKKVLQFYKDETQKYIPEIVKFMMLNEKFENAKKSIESKPKKEVTQEEVDNYNGMIKQINQEINNYNKLNSINTNKNNSLINEWNTVSENFINSHVPRD